MNASVQQPSGLGSDDGRPAVPPARQGSGLSGPELAPADFDRIAAIAYKAAGLAIGTGKAAMVRTRLARRLRALNMPGFTAYCDFLDSPEGAAEIGLLISALTTNVSNFFRESHHFKLLRETVLPPLVARARAGGRVRIWSAGCSNGQEPFSIAMTMIEAGMPFDRDVRVLATDIDPNVIQHARAGIYPQTMLSGLPDGYRNRFFDAVPGEGEPGWRARTELRDAVQFRMLNLLDVWPMRGQFDVIFCRNVVIYFDAPTQDRLWGRFCGQLAPDGWLFIGHSERLSSRVQSRFNGRGTTAYQRADGAASPPPAAANSQERV
ncbi:MAG: protein-glutamate O-methyltransferase [Maritimibacter sp.]|nr:protein-glutamate O-methyltransferase [Maritimibacter sp.]